MKTAAATADPTAKCADLWCPEPVSVLVWLSCLHFSMLVSLGWVVLQLIERGCGRAESIAMSTSVSHGWVVRQLI
jgi:hypothetical protein